MAAMPFPHARDYKAHPDAGPVAAARLWRAGLRLVPIDPKSKRAMRKGFGRDNPDYCAMPEDFGPDELTAVLMGPCPLGAHAGGRWLMGFDLDGQVPEGALEKRLGKLPGTLTSKDGRHLYYWLTSDLPERENIRQGNDIFRTKKRAGWALDWRPCAGGYFLERGDWDQGFDHTRIRDLPRDAWARLLAARQHSGKPPEPCRVPVVYERDQRAPSPALLAAIADDLSAVWPPPGGGGGHDLALALGGILADAWISEDDAIDFAIRIWEGAAAPSQIQEVLTSMIKRRSGSTAAVYGWPKLREILTEHNGHELATRALASFAQRMPGLAPPKFPRPRAPKGGLIGPESET